MTSAAHKKDYRGFLFILHDIHGILLLHCTRKKNKPPHWQLPGGHIDEADFVQAAAATTNDVPQETLLLAGKIGAARELFEETGMDVRSQLDRLKPAMLVKEEETTEQLSNLSKNRLFYFLSVTNDDFPQNDGAGGVESMVDDQTGGVQLHLSHEHSGFKFQPSMATAVKELSWHSGGKVSAALAAAMQASDALAAREGAGAVADLTPTTPRFFPRDLRCCWKPSG